MKQKILILTCILASSLCFCKTACASYYFPENKKVSGVSEKSSKYGISFQRVDYNGDIVSQVYFLVSYKDAKRERLGYLITHHSYEKSDLTTDFISKGKNVIRRAKIRKNNFTIMLTTRNNQIVGTWEAIPEKKVFLY